MGQAATGSSQQPLNFRRDYQLPWKLAMWLQQACGVFNCLSPLQQQPRFSPQHRRDIKHRSQPAAVAAMSWPCCTGGAERPQLRRWQQDLWQEPGRPLQPAKALLVEAPSTAMAVEEAWQLLEEFSAKEARGLAQMFLDSSDKRQRLRDALLVAAGAPHVPAGWSPDAAEVPEVLLAVLASDVRLAVRALHDYCRALGLAFKMPESRVQGVPAVPAIQGSVYLKYNSASGLCYATKYEGRDRGVLVQLGQQQLGHLPLGLHDEQMARLPPGSPEVADRVLG